MKTRVISALIALSGLVGAPSMAQGQGPSGGFSTEFYFYNAGTLIARLACPDLGIRRGTFFGIAAQKTYFILERFDSPGFTPVLKYAVPSQGSYIFENNPGFVITNEFRTRNLDIKRNTHTGDVYISLKTSSGISQCLLNSCPAYGACN